MYKYNPPLVNVYMISVAIAYVIRKIMLPKKLQKYISKC